MSRRVADVRRQLEAHRARTYALEREACIDHEAAIVDILPTRAGLAQRHPWASCFDKVQHPTEPDARRAAAHYIVDHGGWCGIYRCALCEQWHLTTRRA